MVKDLISITEMFMEGEIDLLTYRTQSSTRVWLDIRTRSHYLFEMKGYVDLVVYHGIQQHDGIYFWGWGPAISIGRPWFRLNVEN